MLLARYLAAHDGERVERHYGRNEIAHECLVKNSSFRPSTVTNQRRTIRTGVRLIIAQKDANHGFALYFLQLAN